MPNLKIGYLPQEPLLDPEKTVRQEVESGLGEAFQAQAMLEQVYAAYAEDDADFDKLAEEQARLEAIIAATGSDLGSQLELAADALRLPAWDGQIGKLSGGEKRRVALCKLLLSRPDMLLLDEPTNHLDAESVEWLEQFLARFPGTVVAVTHDRYFLDNAAEWILELDRGPDAKFVNPLVDDYRLLPGSPAINAGRDVTSFGVTFDFDNLARPSGAIWDAGAFELSGNQKPVVTVGANQTITLPTNTTTITGSATDADGTISTYLWTKQSGPAATLTNQSTTTVTLADLVAGGYTFRLTATDNGGETGFKDVTVTVVDPSVNQPPVANAGGTKTITLPTNSTTLNGSWAKHW